MASAHLLQAVVAYPLVALALAWIVWSVVLPRAVKQRLRGTRKGAAPAASPSCACHDEPAAAVPQDEAGPWSTPPPD